MGSKIWGWIEKCTYMLMGFLCKIIGKPLTESRMEGVMQFVRFGIVGVSNTIISYVIYVVCLLFFQKMGILKNIDYIIAQVTQFVLSVLWSFYWNNRMVFTLKEGEKRSVWKALIKTYISYSFTGLFINSALLIVWVKVMHISEFIAPVINLLISVPLNFIINKFWAFKAN